MAEKLGVTNKAVSKWETGEAMPDSALLLPLAEALGVSVDELLRGERTNDDSASESDKEGSTERLGAALKDVAEHWENYPHHGHRHPQTNYEKITGAITGAWFMACLIAYFIAGYFGHWDYWAIIPAGAMLCGTLGCIFNLFNKSEKEDERRDGDNPVVGNVCGIIVCTCIAVYLSLGCFGGLWHPWWIILPVGGFACAIIACIGSIFGK